MAEGIRNADVLHVTSEYGKSLLDAVVDDAVAVGEVRITTN